ncbi:hypothetical protein ACQPYK_49605 (plasmid) [Streptosporangium sp. CA-135522]|uniref:hypothetical protein n=1 Tax=Streptosporangium sp. CA-135522 TaxID=3240072 RepID=UPI003D8E39F2
MATRCPQAEELHDAHMAQALAELDPDRPPRIHADWMAAHAARRDLYVATTLHYEPDPAIDPQGFQQWKSAAENEIPRYGYTPGGRAIHTTNDPDYGRTRCACGLAWAANHSPGDGTGCPEHLKPRHIRHPNLDTPADQEFRARYEMWAAEFAERRAQRARRTFRCVS